MEDRELTDEEKAVIYIWHTHIKYNNILSQPEVVNEIRKAYIAGCKDVRKELTKLIV